jgi:hypothetical protein
MGDAPSMLLVLGNPIANPRFGQHDPRVVRVIFNLLPQLADIDAEILRIFGVGRAPYRSENLFVGHYPTGVLCQE